MPTKNEMRRIKQDELRLDIAEGRVDIGPSPVHDTPIVDTRDQRDPQVLGHMMSTYRSFDPHSPMSKILDDIAAMPDSEWVNAAPYDPSETSLQSTVATRQKELRDRAARGDKYAISMLETGLPGDSDE